ncbi:MAG TPA: hypothetical protein VF065_05210 [Ilumatobacter sp.]
MDSAFAWKQFYAEERERLGRDRLLAMVDEAERLDVRDGGAIVIPHTRIEVTGNQIAVAVATVLASGAERVLALGVLHGARRADRDLVAAARAGDGDAIATLRGVHDEHGLAAEEFSLDGFLEMLTLAADRAGRSMEVARRYPFLVGEEPASLDGLEELEQLVGDGALLVATTDPVHHGYAYGTAPSECLDPEDPRTMAVARSAIGDQLGALSDHRFGDFAQLTEQHRSDFRDTGPTLAQLVGRGFASEIHDLALVDYADVLEAARPSWVAGALVTI